MFYACICKELIEARFKFRDRLTELGFDAFVEPFDPEKYNDQATIGENILFVDSGHQMINDILSVLESLADGLFGSNMGIALLYMSSPCYSSPWTEKTCLAIFQLRESKAQRKSATLSLNRGLGRLSKEQPSASGNPQS